MIVVPPAVKADKLPFVTLIVATVGALLTHVPPAIVLASVDDVPVHTDDEPAIVAGAWLTVTMALVKHPVVGIL